MLPGPGLDGGAVEPEKLLVFAAVWHERSVPQPSVPQASRPRSFETALGVAVVLATFGLAVSRAASSGQWRDDLASVRDLGFVTVGLGGALSTLVAQVLGLLPLGPKVFRAALGSALALAAASWFLYSISRRLLSLMAPTARYLGPALAALSALTAGLSPTFQREATVGGGAMVAVALSLAILALVLRTASPETGEAELGGARFAGVVGALLGATLAESLPAGLTVMASLTVLVGVPKLVVRARTNLRATHRQIAVGVVSGLLVLAALLLPQVLRPLAPRAWVDVGRALSASSLGAIDVAAERTTALAAWTREIGVVSLAVAVFGGVVAGIRMRLRAVVAALFAIVAADVLVPASVTGLLIADARTPLRALALAALAVTSALGVARAVEACLGFAGRIPMARPAAVLLVLFHVTLVAVASEEADFVADRSEQMGAEEWTDEALATLEPRAAVLVSSPAVAWRLWAARVTRGERPDVVIVPAPLLDRGRVASTLLATEPVLDLLLRDYALSAAPSELALSKLADTRPLHVELEGEWPKALVKHLVVDGMWMELSPQPLGPSDRKLATAATLTPLRRVIMAVRRTQVPDASTAAVLTKTLEAQVRVLEMLGEKDEAEVLEDGIAALTLGDTARVVGPDFAQTAPAIRSVAAAP